MAANLSDRLIDSSKDVLQKMCESDCVQKILMTGDLSGKHRLFIQRSYKNLSDLKPYTEKMFKEMSNLSDLTPEEKAFYQNLDQNYAPLFSKYLDELKATVDPIPDDVLSAPPNPIVIKYEKMFSDPIGKGSVIKSLVASFVGYAVPVAIHSYLVNNPSYKENLLAKLMTFSTMDVEKASIAVKALIDNRANEVNQELEAELKAQVKNMLEFQLAEVTKQYNQA